MPDETGLNTTTASGHQLWAFVRALETEFPEVKFTGLDGLGRTDLNAFDVLLSRALGRAFAGGVSKLVLISDGDDDLPFRGLGEIENQEDGVWCTVTRDRYLQLTSHK